MRRTQVLGPQRAPLFCRHYSVREEGNCDLSPYSDPHQEFRRLNVLREVRALLRSFAAVCCGVLRGTARRGAAPLA